MTSRPQRNNQKKNRSPQPVDATSAADKDAVEMRDEVFVFYSGLPKTTIGIVCNVIDRRRGMLCVRIPLVNIPRRLRHRWRPDSEHPAFISFVVVEGEWTLVEPKPLF
jgi:hypothetical protein